MPAPLQLGIAKVTPVLVVQVRVTGYPGCKSGIEKQLRTGCKFVAYVNPRIYLKSEIGD